MAPRCARRSPASALVKGGLAAGCGTCIVPAMPKPNFAYAKRQRELANKQKKEEKRQRKAAAARDASPEGTTPPPADGNEPTK